MQSRFAFIGSTFVITLLFSGSCSSGESATPAADAAADTKKQRDSKITPADQATSADLPKTDAITADVMTSDKKVAEDSTLPPDKGIEPDGLLHYPGDKCENPVVMTLSGNEVTYDGTTTDKADYVQFKSPACLGATFYFPNYDMIHKFEGPPGTYLAVLHPKNGNYDAALLLVEADSCTTFNSGCVDYSDTFTLGTDEELVFEVKAGKSYYLIVDSSRDPWGSFPEETSGDYSLTVKSWAYSQLGSSCSKWYECSSWMCLDFNYDKSKNCSEFCTSDSNICNGSAVPTTCIDCSRLYTQLSPGDKLCVPTSIVDQLDNGQECSVYFECNKRACVYYQPYDPKGVCYTDCEASASACDLVNEECIDVTVDIDELFTTKICLAKSTKNTIATGGACHFSYECQSGAICQLGTCLIP